MLNIEHFFSLQKYNTVIQGKQTRICLSYSLEDVAFWIFNLSLASNGFNSHSKNNKLNWVPKFLLSELTDLIDVIAAPHPHPPNSTPNLPGGTNMIRLTSCLLFQGNCLHSEYFPLLIGFLETNWYSLCFLWKKMHSNFLKFQKNTFRWFNFLSQYVLRAHSNTVRTKHLLFCANSKEQ